MSAARDFDVSVDAIVPRRRPRVRKHTISIKRLAKRDLEAGRRACPPEETALYDRPVTRADCDPCGYGEHAQRPCPHISCKHHLYLDVNDRTGSITLNFPDKEVWELAESCALDIADRGGDGDYGGASLEEVGVVMNLTRERIRQLETRGFAKLEAALAETRVNLADFLDTAAPVSDEEPEGGITLDEMEVEFGQALQGAAAGGPTEP